MQLRTLSQLGSLLNQNQWPNVPFRKICVDSRALKPGDFFCALPGSRTNGSFFVEEALQKGACAALISADNSDMIPENRFPGKLISVSNVLEILQELAKQHFKRNRPKLVIAITGSLGKTTTKDFCAAFLNSDFSVFKSPGNQNSQIGLPLAILNNWNGEEAVVLEMGMTEKGQIQRLAEIIAPDIAVVTCAGLVHAENFSSLNHIAKAKFEIFSQPRMKKALHAHEIVSMIGKAGLTFSTRHAEADYFLYKCLEGWFLKHPKGHMQLPFDIQLAPHNRHNLLAAMSVALEAQVPWKTIVDKIPHLELPERRLQKVEKNGVIFINDSYNAAEESFYAAFDALPNPPVGNCRIGIAGSMLELGAFSEECHRNVGIKALQYLDQLICFGDEWKPVVELWQKQGRAACLLNDHQAVAEKLYSIVKAGDVVLLKGSRNKMLWKILEYK